MHYQIPRSFNPRKPSITCKHHKSIPSEKNMNHDQIICSINLVDEYNSIGMRRDLDDAFSTPVMTFTFDINLKDFDEEKQTYKDFEVKLNGFCNHSKGICEGVNLQQVIYQQPPSMDYVSPGLSQKIDISQSSLPQSIPKSSLPQFTPKKNNDVMNELNFRIEIKKTEDDDGNPITMNKERCEKIGEKYISSGYNTFWMDNEENKECIGVSLTHGVLEPDKLNSETLCNYFNNNFSKDFEFDKEIDDIKTKKNKIVKHSFERKWNMVWDIENGICIPKNEKNELIKGIDKIKFEPIIIGNENEEVITEKEKVNKNISKSSALSTNSSYPPPPPLLPQQSNINQQSPTNNNVIKHNLPPPPPPPLN